MSTCPADPIRPPASRRPGVTAWLVAGSALALAGWVVATRFAGAWPLDVHLRDDSYYYFCWARSVLDGEGPWVTPGVATTGLHLLYPVGLVLLGLAVGVAALPAWSLWLGLLLHLGVAVWIGRAAGRSLAVGVTVASVYAGSPYLAGEMIHAQTGIACLAFVLFATGHHRSPKGFFVTGLVAVLARSDLIFFVAAMALAVPRERARRLLWTAGILLVYALVNLGIAGHLLQDSALPIPWLMAEGAEHAGLSYWDRIESHLGPVLRGTRFRLSSTPLAAAWLFLAWLGVRGGDRRYAWLLVGGLALVCFHDLWRLYPRDYYFAPLGVAGALALVELLRVRPRIGWALAVLAVVWNGRHAGDPQTTYPWQREMSMAGRRLGDLLPPETSVGCFNAGLVTWHHRRVVNLDGVVNRPAFAALRAGRMSAYLREQGLDFVVDNPIQFARTGVHANGRHFGEGFRAARDLEECVRFERLGPRADRGRAGIEWFSLYRVQGRGGVLRLPEGLTDLGPAPGGRFVAWRAQRGESLRSDRVPMLAATATVLYVLELPWDGLETLRLEAGSAPVLLLEIPPSGK